MCGIAGIFRQDGPAGPAELAMVERMLDAQRHRGPDGAGIRLEGHVALGHRRLAIIDLSPAGAQPMRNETGDVWITFNGEIYNYRELRPLLSNHKFHSLTDTEILIHGYEEWGIDGLLERLRGMFTFGIYDGRAGHGPKLILARDRLGIKPVYYTHGGGALGFASEVRALRKAGLSNGELDRDAAIGFLCFGSVPSPSTWFRDVRCLPPGSYIEATREQIREQRYWDLMAPRSAVEAGPELMNETIGGHLLSDVPLGVFLSGGLDSAGVAAVASRLTKKLFTVTVSFAEKEFDESAETRAIAEHYGTDHHEVRVGDAEFLSELPKILAAMDQPSIDGVNTYFVSRAARGLGLTVVLSGLGGDEVFLGYPLHRELAGAGGGLSRLARLPAALRNAGTSLAKVYGAATGEDRWGRLDYLRGRPVNDGLYMLMRGLTAPETVARLSGIGARDVEDAVSRTFASLPLPAGNGHADLAHVNAIEFHRYLHDQLLRDSDVFSMAHSLELRVPYLDHKVVEYGMSLPAADKISAAMNKPKLVELLADPFLEAVARRPKKGFTFPFARWMRTHAGALEEVALRGSPFEPSEVRKQWAELRAGKLHWSRAWATVAAAAATEASR